MSLSETFSRHRIIIQKLRNKACGFDEISKKLKLESEISGRNYEVSIRTFQRDIQDIEELYNIEISFNKSTKVYEIVEDLEDDYTQRMFEAFDVFQALQSRKDFNEFIQFDLRKPAGTEYLAELLHATKEKKQVEIRYQKFWNSNLEIRLIEPYLLKEFRRRWYVFAFDVLRKDFRVFGLDRIELLTVKELKFEHPKKINSKKMFEDVFGIIGTSDDFTTQNIKLAFRKKKGDAEDLPNQGEYVKTMPLHPSQKIIKDTPEEIIIELYLKPNWEFIMEILFYGEYVEVLEPENLRKKVVNRLTSALQNYND